MNIESKQFADKAAGWIDDKKGSNIRIIDLDGVSIIADYFVIASGDSERQVKAIADNVEDEAAKEGFEPKNVEGKHNGRWILLDYGDVVVHLFHEEDRQFYDLERLWKDGKTIRFPEE